MGGKAFTSGPNALSTPRLPPDLYFTILEHIIGQLKTLYVHVASPPPGKSSMSILFLHCSTLLKIQRLLELETLTYGYQ